jgi:hypothetical protein
MSGKICYGESWKNSGAARTSQSKAYCEGMGYRAAGGAPGFPLIDNPYVAGSPDWVAWGAGWNVADDNTGSTMDKADSGCCQVMGAISA